MRYLNFNNKLFASLLASFALFGCGGGGSYDPKPQNFPRNEIKFTTADIQGSAVKGTFANAEVTVEQLNGSNLSINGNATTDENGAFSFSVQGDRGFGLDSVAMLYVDTTDTATMRCDALGCGLGDTLQGEQLATLRLSSIAMLSVPFGNPSNSEADLETQVNGLSTLASRLMLTAYQAGELNLATQELLQAAMSSYSAQILKALGVDEPAANIFNTALADAATLDSLQEAFVQRTCTDDSDPASCSETLDTSGVKLSLANGALSGLIGQSIVTGESCEEVEVLDDTGNPVIEEQCSDIIVELSNLAEAFDFATAIIAQAIAAPDNASALVLLEPLRQALLDNFIEHPFIADLGLNAASIIDVELSFKQAEVLSGPQQEILTDTATITARASISEAESEAQAFDSDETTKWLDNQSVPSETDPAWIQVQFTEAQAINSVVITSANDAPERDPENFNLAGSNDGETWQTVGSIAGVRFDDRFQRQVFRFANGLEYSYYRLNITKNAGDVALMQIAEIDFVGPIYTSQDHSDPLESLTVTARGSISEGESETQAFDNSTETKWLDNTATPTAEAPSWIQAALPAPAAVNAVAITSGNDAPERDPENFSLQGSNDAGATWVELGQWAGVSFDERLQRQIFTLNNALAYATYRLNISKNRGDIDLMQITEIELIGPKVADVKVSHQEGVSYEGRASISEAEATEKAFDGDTASKWLDNASVPSVAEPSWVSISLPEAKAVNRLSLTSANDAPERDPENFFLEASEDGENWITLAQWLGESFDERFQRREFTFTNSLAFSFYRFNITKNAGDSPLMQIAEIELIAPVYVGSDYSSSDGVVASARASISEGESEDKAFDNDSASKWLDNEGVPSVASPSWIQIDLATAQVVDTLAITSANDAPERDPADFQLLGSNDAGASWVVVGSWSGESYDQRFQRKVYPASNGFAYTTYRLNITKNNGDNSLTQIAEIEFIGPQP